MTSSIVGFVVSRPLRGRENTEERSGKHTEHIRFTWGTLPDIRLTAIIPLCTEKGNRNRKSPRAPKGGGDLDRID